MFRRNHARAKSTGGLDILKPKKKDADLCRSRSCPVAMPRKLRGIMKHTSADSSLHSTYGSTDENEGKKKVEHITLTNIEIREYARTIGDNPSCSSGPPVSISWEHTEETTLSVETYESTRPPRRSNIEMILPRDLRQRMLKKEWGVTQAQIASAVRTNIKIKNQRRQTVNNLNKSSKFEEAMESATKGLFGGSTDRKVRKLEKQMEAAEKARMQLLVQENLDSCDSEGTDDPESTYPMDMDAEIGH